MTICAAVSATASGAQPSTEQVHWQWPLDPTHYDQTPTPSPTEYDALLALGWELRRGRTHDPYRPEWAAIERLLRPLDDARFCLSVSPGRYHQRSVLDAVALILHGCATQQSAFWAWTPTTWVEILGPDQQTFQRAFPGWLDAAVRPYMVGIAYLLNCFAAFELLGPFNRTALAAKVFGPARVNASVEPIMEILAGWGYQSARTTIKYPGLICSVLLLNRSPDLVDLTTPVIERLRQSEALSPTQRAALYGVQRALAALGLVDSPGSYLGPQAPRVEGVNTVWQEWVERWTATSTLTHKVRLTFRTILLKVGRWLAMTHPAVCDPSMWTRELCADFLAMVERLVVGDYAQRRSGLTARLGQPLSARSKAGYSVAVRTFFRDCQEWEWIARRFDPTRAFATPPSIRALLGPNPRVIADEVWAKLLWAGLNLAAQD